VSDFFSEKTYIGKKITKQQSFGELFVKGKKEKINSILLFVIIGSFFANINIVCSK